MLPEVDLGVRDWQKQRLEDPSRSRVLPGEGCGHALAQVGVDVERLRLTDPARGGGKLRDFVYNSGRRWRGPIRPTRCCLTQQRVLDRTTNFGIELVECLTDEGA